MHRFLHKLTLVLIGASFFVPLVLASESFIFPFIVPKVLLFRSLTLVMVGVFVLLLYSDAARYQLRATPLSLAVVLWLMSFVISTFVGVDWYHSFWDNHERMLGLFTFFHYFLYYLVVTTVVTDWAEWQWLFRVFLFAGSLVMLIAGYQAYANHTAFLNQSHPREAATLGNPIYVGGYGLFLAFMAWLMVKTERSRWWQALAAAEGILGTAGIFWSGTRGSFVGWAAGIGVLGLWYLCTLKNSRRARLAIAGVLAAGAATLGILFLLRENPRVQQLPAIGSLVGIKLGSGTASTRLMAWSIGIEAWRERPIFGWGPNNFLYAFNQYYRPQFLEHGWGETWFDNSHNILVNTLATYGLIGLLVYLGLFAAVITLVWRAYQAGTVPVDVAGVVIAFAAAHLIQNVFVFENPTSYLYFFFWLAFVNQRLFPRSAVDGALDRGKRVSPFVIGAVSLAVIMAVYATDINPARANRATLSTLKHLYSGEDPVGSYRAAAAIPSPHIDDIRNDFARTVFTVLPNYVSAGRADQAKQLLFLANDELQKNRSLHPRDIRVHIQQAQLAQQATTLLHDQSLLLSTEATLTEALSYSPRRQMLYYLLGSVKLMIGKGDEGLAMFRRSIADDPKVGEGWWRLAYIYTQLNRPDDAKAVVREARAAGALFDSQGQDTIDKILPPASSSAAGKS